MKGQSSSKRTRTSILLPVSYISKAPPSTEKNPKSNYGRLFDWSTVSLQYPIRNSYLSTDGHPNSLYPRRCTKIAPVAPECKLPRRKLAAKLPAILSYKLPLCYLVSRGHKVQYALPRMLRRYTDFIVNPIQPTVLPEGR